MKGENAIKKMLIIAVLITVLIAGTLSFLGATSEKYGKSPNVQTLNRSIEIQDEIQDIYELFENEENIQSNWLGDTLVTGGKIVWGFITLVIKVPGSLGDLVHDLGTAIGIPTIYLVAGSVIILIVGIFAILEILTSGSSA